MNWFRWLFARYHYWRWDRGIRRRLLRQVQAGMELNRLLRKAYPDSLDPKQKRGLWWTVR